MSELSNVFMIKGKNDNGFVQMPEPKRGGIGVTDEPIWSANTGRSSTGKMIGDVVAWKTTIEVAFPPLSYEHAKRLRDAIRNAGDFFQIRYMDIESGNTTNSMPTTKTVYVGNVPRLLVSLSPKQQRYEGIDIKFIEQ